MKPVNYNGKVILVETKDTATDTEQYGWFHPADMMAKMIEKF